MALLGKRLFCPYNNHMPWYFSKKEQLLVAILLVAMLGALAVLGFNYGKRVKNVEQGQFFTPSASSQSDQSSDQLVVHVSGAVKTPGVYTFPKGARINDAIDKAGGSLPNGFPDALNRAEKLKDGEKIYVPTKAEWQKQQETETPPLVQLDGGMVGPSVTAKPASASSTKPSSGSPGHSDKKEPPKNKISVNTASADQLMTIPGIGPATAANILNYRTQHGKFTDLSQLLNIPKIGQKTLDKISPFLKL